MSTPAPCKINIFCDSDGPIADFDLALQQSNLPVHEFKMRAGSYLYLPVTAGAAAAIHALEELDNQNKIRVWILTKTPSGSPYAYTEKVLWYRQHFPWLEDRVIVTHDKHLLGKKTDFLLDDRPHKAHADKFCGTFVLFETDKPKVSWSNFLDLVGTRLDA